MPAHDASLTGDRLLAAMTQVMVAFHQRYHRREASDRQNTDPRRRSARLRTRRRLNRRREDDDRDPTQNDQGVSRPPTQRGQDQKRSDPLPQTPPRPPHLAACSTRPHPRLQPPRHDPPTPSPSALRRSCPPPA